MDKLTTTLLAYTLAAVSGCAYYDLSVEGKQCKKPDHPCPSGFDCVPVADGGSTCQKAVPDAGVDGGDQICAHGESVCAGPHAVSICEDGDWTARDCDQNEYCFEVEDLVAADCVEFCAESADCSEIVLDYYCDTINPDAPVCAPRGDCDDNFQVGVPRCSTDGTKVLVCDEESGKDIEQARCEVGQYCDIYDPSCKNFCVDDRDCAPSPSTSCNLRTRKCQPTGLCGSDGDCDDGICVDPPDGACALPPTDQVESSGGTVLLDCYTTPAGPATGPATCHLTGAVVEFFRRVPLDHPTQLLVELRPLQEILDGRLETPAFSVDAVDDGNGKSAYTINDVPTNTEYVMAVQCEPDAVDCLFETLFTFSVFLRADDCQSEGGTLTLGAPALWAVNYPSYANPPGGTPGEAENGVVIGWLKECDDHKIINGTGGLSIPHSHLYYLPSGGPADLSDPNTNSPGFFAANNVQPIRGVAAALVLQSTSAISLKVRPLRVFPGKASLVIFDRPKKPGQ